MNKPGSHDGVKFSGIKGLTVAAALTAAFSSAACLVATRTHTLYLSPAGQVTWVALEQDVRSNSEKPAEREAEEAAFLSAALAGTHDVAAALESLAPTQVQTVVLRRERPFMAATTARYGSIEQMLETLFQQAGIDGHATLTSDGTRTKLIVRIDLRMHEPIDGPWTALIEEASRYQITLTEGRFVEAHGFTLLDGGRSAAPREVDPEQARTAAEMVWVLVWTR